LTVALFAIGFVLLARFLPPPPPTAGAQEIARLLAERSEAIRAGMCVCVLASAFLLPWGGAISAQLRRLKHVPALAHTWTAANALLVVEFIFPCLWWAVAAFRPQSDPDLIQKFNDMAWLSFMGIISTALIQCLILAAAAFQEAPDGPVYPRWFGYFQAWTLVLLTPDLVVYLFMTGPLAWNGLFAFWTETTVAFIWLVVTTQMTVRAGRAAPAPAVVSTLEQRVAALEQVRTTSS
jgi:hypothetical protein